MSYLYIFVGGVGHADGPRSVGDGGYAGLYEEAGVQAADADRPLRWSAVVMRAVARFLPAESLATASCLCQLVVVCDPLGGVVGVLHGDWELVV